MGRFFFHIRDGDMLVPDEEGCHLPDLDAVKTEAAQTARELRGQVVSDDYFLSETPRIEVRDDIGHLVMTVPVHVHH